VSDTNDPPGRIRGVRRLTMLTIEYALTLTAVR
jgi:hypothetical protein